MCPFTEVFLYALDLYVWVIIASAIFSWLYAFNVINPNSPAVATIGDVLHRLTDPVLRPIRKHMPDLGGIDISPIILFLGIILVNKLIVKYMIIPGACI